jgi:hypothetical protein
MPDEAEAEADLEQPDLGLDELANEEPLPEDEDGEEDLG